MTHDLTKLKEFWLVEHMHTDKFTWKKLIVRLFKNTDNRNFYFWWRLAHEMYKRGNKNQTKTAKKIQYKLISKYNTEIQLGAKIGKGLKIEHFLGVEISGYAEIGENFICHQMVNIAWNKAPCEIKIGDNVLIGCGSIILGGKISIGNNVKVGAMSFINKDIPDNCTVYTKKTNEIKINY
ncbi:serine acetyltransferase [Orbaceae bacterium ac157xtp]